MIDAVNFKDQILDAANGEPILGAVIGEFGWGDRDKPVLTSKLLTWEEVAPTLDYMHEDWAYNPQCHAIYAWTDSRVLFVHEYDGQTSVKFVPRNPIDCVCFMNGNREVRK